jgi:hypothetical protein
MLPKVGFSSLFEAGQTGIVPASGAVVGGIDRLAPQRGIGAVGLLELSGRVHLGAGWPFARALVGGAELRRADTGLVGEVAGVVVGPATAGTFNTAQRAGGEFWGRQPAQAETAASQPISRAVIALLP